jgi:hypothetical protein
MLNDIFKASLMLGWLVFSAMTILMRGRNNTKHNNQDTQGFDALIALHIKFLKFDALICLLSLVFKFLPAIEKWAGFGLSMLFSIGLGIFIIQFSKSIKKV